MARTINGKLMGKAAQTEMRDLQERIEAERIRVKERTEELCMKIFRATSLDEYSDWLDMAPDDNNAFLKACEEKWAELQPHAVEQATELEVGEFPSDDLVLAWSEKPRVFQNVTVTAEWAKRHLNGELPKGWKMAEKRNG